MKREKPTLEARFRFVGLDVPVPTIGARIDLDNIPLLSVQSEQLIASIALAVAKALTAALDEVHKARLNAEIKP